MGFSAPESTSGRLESGKEKQTAEENFSFGVDGGQNDP
jgi:hypothetical protein